MGSWSGSGWLQMSWNEVVGLFVGGGFPEGQEGVGCRWAGPRVSLNTGSDFSNY